MRRASARSSRRSSRAISRRVMPLSRIAIASADICSSATAPRVYASTTQSICPSASSPPVALGPDDVDGVEGFRCSHGPDHRTSGRPYADGMTTVRRPTSRRQRRSLRCWATRRWRRPGTGRARWRSSRSAAWPGTSPGGCSRSRTCWRPRCRTSRRRRCSTTTRARTWIDAGLDSATNVKIRAGGDANALDGPDALVERTAATLGNLRVALAAEPADPRRAPDRPLVADPRRLPDDAAARDRRARRRPRRQRRGAHPELPAAALDPVFALLTTLSSSASTARRRCSSPRPGRAGAVVDHHDLRVGWGRSRWPWLGRRVRRGGARSGRPPAAHSLKPRAHASSRRPLVLLRRCGCGAST